MNALAYKIVTMENGRAVYIFEMVYDKLEDAERRRAAMEQPENKRVVALVLVPTTQDESSKW
jgi:hypothetical protein